MVQNEHFLKISSDGYILILIIFLQRSGGNELEEDPYLRDLGMLSAVTMPASGPQQFWPFPERPKPPCSMKELAVIALNSKSDKMGSPQEVCDFISRHFPYYRQNNRWNHSLKCTMGDKRFFIKQPKRHHYSEYTINPDYYATVDFENIKAKLKRHVDIDL